MRDIIRFFRQTYRAVHTEGDRTDIESAAEAAAAGSGGSTATGGLTHSEASEKFRCSSVRSTRSGQQQPQQSHRSISKGFSILDVFFNQPKRGRGPRWPKGVFLLKASGLLMIIVAIVLHILQPYTAIFRWKLIFAENGEIYNLWQNPPVEVYIKIYLYNITNAAAFMAGTEPKLRVQQVGPYVYRERLVHDDVVFNGNGTLTAVPKHPLLWNAELSGGHREDDMLMVPNIALLSIAQVTADKSFFFRTPVNMLIRQTRSEPIVRMTAREFMFGYGSTLTTLGNQLMPNWIYFEKVGLIDRMYDFSGDVETVFTGELDSTTSGLIDTYRGSSQLKQWKEPHCSDIRMSSDGTKFKSFIVENETLLFYRKSMCRPLRLHRVSNVPQQVGKLTAYRYEFEPNAMDNGVFDERNKCFCRTPDTCLPAGLLDVSDCYYGFPIALSYPHYLESDEKIRQDVLGSKPNRSEHSSFVMIQPMSGLPLKLSVKMQINLAMQDVSNMANVELFSNLVLPMLWFEIIMPELTPTLQTRFNLYLNILPVVDAVGRLLLFSVGVALVLVAIVRAAMLVSRSMQISSSQQQQQRYASLGRGRRDGRDDTAAGVSLTGAASRLAGYDFDDDDDDDDYYDDVVNEVYGATVVSYEMSEKRIRNDEDVVLYEVDLCNDDLDDRSETGSHEGAYMLEREQAVSEEDDEEDSDDDGSSASATERSRQQHSYEDNATVAGLPNLCNENGSYETGGDLMQMDTPQPRYGAPAGCSTGMFTSALEDIATDVFPPTAAGAADSNDDADIESDVSVPGIRPADGERRSSSSSRSTTGSKTHLVP